MNMKLHEKIKKEIKDQGRSITWVSNKLGISQPALSQKLGGDYKFKDAEVDMIEELLDVKFKRNGKTT